MCVCVCVREREIQLVSDKGEDGDKREMQNETERQERGLFLAH